MKYLKVLITMAVFVLLAALALSAADDQSSSNLGENRLVYKVKYVAARDLAKLLDGYVDKSQGMRVDLIEGLNTVVVTAPKDSHPILMKLIEQFDKKPVEMELNIYIVMSFLKKYEAQKNSKTYSILDEDFNKKIDTLNSMNPDIIYEGRGQIVIPLTSKKEIWNSVWTFGFTEDSIAYNFEIRVKKINITDNMIMFEEFTVFLANEKGQATELLFKHSFDIDVTLNKLTITGISSNIFEKNSPKKLELIFWPKILKN